VDASHVSAQTTHFSTFMATVAGSAADGGSGGAGGGSDGGTSAAESTLGRVRAVVAPTAERRAPESTLERARAEEDIDEPARRERPARRRLRDRHRIAAPTGVPVRHDRLLEALIEAVCVNRKAVYRVLKLKGWFVQGGVHLAAQLHLVSRGEGRSHSLGRLVQQAATALGAGLSEPSPVSAARTLTRGLISGEHYSRRVDRGRRRKLYRDHIG